MIEVSNITKTYGKQKALDDVSFTIASGEIVGFLGPNGAGKSTMMKILTGYIKQDAGEARIEGIKVMPGAIESRLKVGYLPENNPLYTEMYIREYLQFVAGFYPVNNVTERIADLIDMTGLGPESHKKIGALSKGYRQRVGLAQALLPNPEVLILDEPTSGLDPNQISEVRDLILALGKQKTVMLSTHIMQEVQAICERAIIIHKGKIVADSSVANLSTTGKSELVVSVEFDLSVEPHELEVIEDVLEVTKQGNLLRLKAGSDIRKAISKLASEKGWLILSMNIEKQSLEEVFRVLTNG